MRFELAGSGKGSFRSGTCSGSDWLSDPPLDLVRRSPCNLYGPCGLVETHWPSRIQIPKILEAMQTRLPTDEALAEAAGAR